MAKLWADCNFKRGWGDRTRSRSATLKLHYWQQVAIGRFPCGQPQAILTSDLRGRSFKSNNQTNEKAAPKGDSFIGRGDRTRTYDLRVPNAAR